MEKLKKLIHFWNNSNIFWNIIKFQLWNVLMQISKWLTGPAMNWYLFIKNRDPSFEYCDWNEFKSSLSKQFKIQNIKQVTRDKLYYLKHNDSLMKYNEIFNKLIMKISVRYWRKRYTQ